MLRGISGSVFNAAVFSDNNFLFNEYTGHGEKERKRHDLALEKLQRARNKWNEDIMKRLDFINKSLREKNEARAYINNVDEAMLEYCQVFTKQIKSLLPAPQFIRFLPSIRRPKKW